MKKNIFNILALMIFLIGISEGLYAQQEPLYTQYMFNGLAINPAYAGSYEEINATLLGRRQWVGVEGAPATETFSLHAPIPKTKATVGFLVMHDKIGVQDQITFNGIYAYRLPLTEQSSLTMGIQVGFNQFQADFAEITTLNAGNASTSFPGLGAGLFYNANKFYAGLSIPQLIEQDLFQEEVVVPSRDGKVKRHYFLYAGYVFTLSPILKLKPHILTKAVTGAPVQIDINASILFKEVLWLGFSWRSFDSIDAIVQLQLTNQLSLGYSYDFYTTSELQQVTSGSHEIGLSYRFRFNTDQVISPRYF